MIWSIFKSRKPVVSKLQFPLYDTHSHILWALDDGAGSIDDTLSFLQRYASLGYRGVVATPHTNHWLFESPGDELVKERLKQLESAMAETQVQIKVGAEIMCRDTYAEKFAAGHFRGIGASYLVEFENRPGVFTPALERFVFEARVSGKTLILAHPERYGDVQSGGVQLVALKERGMLMQINLGSLVGKYGQRAEQLAWQFVSDGTADMLATDVHRIGDFDYVADALAALNHVDECRIETLLCTNPQHVFMFRPEQIDLEQ
jgi:protein-tyrosine phosphatase